MKKFSFNDKSLTLPDSAFELVEHLGFNSVKQAQWAWFELSGAVVSHYLADEAQRLQALLNFFYKERGFKAADEYFSIAAADLGMCFMLRRGNSTTLATALMLLARQLDLPMQLLLLPGTTVIACESAGEFRYIDPLTGNFLSRHHLHALVKGELGNAAPFKARYLKPGSNKLILMRMMSELKAACVLTHEFEAAMECCNLMLEWFPDELNLHRERAFIAHQLGAIHVATADLQFFIDNNPHDPMVELVKMQLRELGEESQTFH
ncbi:tetratricopeptide repeat protein [Shewanella avicenniae]|uniref:Tetratricopeptide repeat protein n=1 Tax=Shewanella avicenniae TaxID=2814294 RepID=A0ABX7QT13_9GAMM|nr:tetratricopeptide repeat protein [Shewanella avicenniae]QSX34621.1 tetratricopeptide repeat protein [Shewanella avicenniae]